MLNIRPKLFKNELPAYYHTLRFNSGSRHGKDSYDLRIRLFHSQREFLGIDSEKFLLSRSVATLWLAKFSREKSNRFIISDLTVYQRHQSV